MKKILQQTKPGGVLVPMIFAILFMYHGIVSAQISDLAGQWLLDENSGTAVTDVSENSNTGTVSGLSWAWVTGKINNALSFGGNDYITFGDPSDASLDLGTGDFTLSAWINLAEDGGSIQTVINKGAFGVQGYGMYIYNKQYLVGAIQGAGGSSQQAYFAGNFSEGTWHHVAVVFDRDDKMYAYIDGQNIGSADITGNNGSVDNSKALYIGRNFVSSYFSGKIDDVRIYSRTLNSEEIQQIYNGLNGNWKFNESSGTEAADISGYSNNATLFNMTSSSWVNGFPEEDGYFRTALSFDGTSDYVMCSDPSNGSLDFGTGDFTLAAWINLAENGESIQTVIDKGALGVQGYGMYIYNKQYLVGAIQGDSGSNQQAYFTGNFSEGTWHHVAVVFDRDDKMYAYIDGQNIGSADITGNNGSVDNSKALYIGRNFVSSYFSGKIDDVRIYNWALNADDIEALCYNFLSVYSEQNYYTSETGAVAICDLDIPSSELSGYYLTAKLGGTVLGTNNTPENGTDLSYTISSLSSGVNTIAVELRSDDDELVFSQDIDIVKKASSSGVETKIDQRNSTVLVDGTAFFPVGMYMYNVTSSDTSDFEAVHNAGFNSIIRWKWNVDPTAATTYLRKAADHKLKVVDLHTAYTIDNLNTYKLGSSKDFWDEYMEEYSRIIDAVGYAKTEDNLIGYYSFDEPLESQIDAGQDLYLRTNAEDGYHPTFVLHSSTIPVGDEYTNWSDILGVDPYWCPPRTSDARSSVDWVSKCVALARDRAKQDYKALWIAPMSEFYSGSHKRAILPAEQRCQTYLSLIHGAKGIFFWPYPVYHDSSWNILSDLADDLRDLAPSMLTQDIEQTVTYSTGILDPKNGDFVDVQVCLRKAPAGAAYDYVMLAANTRGYEIDVNYSISLLASNDKVYRRVFDPTDTWEKTYANGSFSDTLAPFATRAYTFSSTSASPVTIFVDISPNGSFIQEDIHPVSGRTGCTNMMQNPDLEENTLTNWPNYCYPYHAVPRINTANQGWGLETIQDSTGLPAGHGSKCLKIVKDSSMTSNGFLFRLAPEHNDSNGKDYTFSVYLKANQAGYEVRLGSSTEGYTTVYPTTSWDRYSFTVNIPKDVDDHHRFYLLLMSNGTIRADAVQVEETTQYDANPPYKGLPNTFTTN